MGYSPTMSLTTFIWRHAFPLLWLTMMLIWFLWSLQQKPVARKETQAQRWSYFGPTWLAIALMVVPRRWVGPLDGQLYRSGISLYAVCVFAAIVGFALAIWARWQLGGNWSATVTLKQGHVLVQEGPYRWIRHPIYTGLLGAWLATVVAWGARRAFLAVAIGIVATVIKLKREERWMRQQFSGAYSDYCKRSWALLPGLY